MTQKKVLPDALAQALMGGAPLVDPVSPDPAKPEVIGEKVEEVTPAEPATATPAVEAAATDGLATYLKGEIATLKTELTTAAAALTESQKANTALQAQVAAFAADNVPGLKTALGNVVQRLSVPLNAVLVGVESFTGAQLVGAYETLNAKLGTQLSAGAKSVTHETSAKPAEVNPSAVPLTQAARISPKKD